MNLSVWASVVFLFCGEIGGEEADLRRRDELDASRKAEALFRRLFVVERAEQLAAVKSLLKIGKEEKRNRMVLAIAEKVFTVIEKSRAVLENSGYVPGISSFPEDEKTRDALSNIVENTAFFGDIVLRLPETTHALLDENSRWGLLYAWSVNFTNQTALADNNTNRLIDLVSQEMNYTKRNENYTNPYRKAKTSAREPPSPPPPEEVGRKAKRRKAMARGPRLSARAINTEL